MSRSAVRRGYEASIGRREKLTLQARLLSLPCRKGTQAAAKDLSDAAAPRRSKRHDALSREQVGLPRLSTEAAVLSERACPKDPSLHPMRALAIWHATSQDRGVQHLALSAQKGRDAVRPPQTHPETRSAAIARAEWRPRRIPPRRHRAKLRKLAKLIPAPASIATT